LPFHRGMVGDMMLRVILIYIYICINRAPIWPLHDIAITDMIWCMALKGRVGGGGVYCAMVVQ